MQYHWKQFSPGFFSVLIPITDAMSDEGKMAVFQTEFDRLYDPSHPVRNHLEILDSIEEVRIIHEALKR